MNLDFHYYVTYHAACEAGFNRSEAKEIAWSAQMVDEMTLELIKERKLKECEYVLTCQNIMDNLWDNCSWLSDEKNETLQKVRKIWVPFHFLPGNLPNEPATLHYSGKTTWSHLQYQDRDERDFFCLCCPNSKLAEAMINDTVQKANGRDCDIDKLNLIGIRMHVLADTWAHQAFVGSPNYWINDVSGIVIGASDSVSQMKTPVGVSNYEITYLGHGRIGHLPDYGYAQYSYQPRWSSIPVNVNNTQRFLSAYNQMVEAMKCILENRNFTITNAASGVLEEQVKDAITFYAQREEEIWKNWEGITHLQPFAKPKQSDRLLVFSNAAGCHRDFVIQYVNNVFMTLGKAPYFI